MDSSVISNMLPALADEEKGQKKKSYYFDLFSWVVIVVETNILKTEQWRQKDAPFSESIWGRGRLKPKYSDDSILDSSVISNMLPALADEEKEQKKSNFYFELSYWVAIVVKTNILKSEQWRQKDAPFVEE